jgi:hypothetical protein
MNNDQVETLSLFRSEALRWRIEETTSKYGQNFMDVLNTQSQTAVKGRSSSLELRGVLDNSSRERSRLFPNFTNFGGVYGWIMVIWILKRRMETCGLDAFGS